MFLARTFSVNKHCFSSLNLQLILNPFHLSIINLQLKNESSYENKSYSKSKRINISVVNEQLIIFYNISCHWPHMIDYL